jgi:hypothetical protein
VPETTRTNRTPPPAESELDSARTFLEALAQERGTRLLPESDYVETRRMILHELATGPRARPFTLVTFALIGLVLVAFFGLGLSMWLTGNPPEWLLAVSSGGCLIMWAYTLRQYLVGLREQARMTLQARLDEVADLRRSGLITHEEYEQIYAAILSSRGLS